MSLLDESLAFSTELGMRPLMERMLSRREILGARSAATAGDGTARCLLPGSVYRGRVVIIAG